MIDLVLVNVGDDKFLFEAPAFSDLKKGDQVVCENDIYGNVNRVLTLGHKKDEILEFIADLCSGNLPLHRIKAKITEEEFGYDE